MHAQRATDIARLQRLTRDPAHAAQAHHALGLVYMGQGHYQQAEAALRQAVAARPDFAAAWGDLGSCLSVQGYHDGPLQAFSQALRLAPRDLDLIQRVARELLGNGHVALARRCYELVCRERPDDVDAATGLGDAMARGGQSEEATALLRPLVQAGRLTPKLVVSWAQRAPADEAVGPLLTVLEQGWDRSVEAHLRFALGRVLDSLGRWEEAFAAYARANALQGLRHDPAADEAEVNAIIEGFGPDALARRHQAPDRGARTVLIVGLPRSGTSLAEQILASHPQVHGAGEREELRLLSLAAPRYAEGAWPGCMDAVSAQLADELGAVYESRVGAEAGDATWITDKMPANRRYLGLAAQILPQARVIWCLRDERDTALSCFFQQFHHAHAWSTRLDWVGHRVRQHRRLRAHWRDHLPLPMHTLRYEALVADPEGQSRALLDFLDLSWDPAVLRFHTNDRFVGTASHEQVRRPIYHRSVGRAEHYAPWLGPLDQVLARS